MASPVLEHKSSAQPIEFLKGFLRRPKEVASVIPSSPFLIRRVVKSCNVGEARVLVELGPGTGVLTRELLREMPAGGKLVAIEINPDFALLLQRKYPDPRLTVFEGHSGLIRDALAVVGETHADLVVSGIPFSTMGDDQGRQTLEVARESLNPDGRFVAYQFRDHVRRLAEPIFGPAAMTHGELLNIPPMRVYTWKRPASSVAVS